jgi:hypothetical protein
MNSRIKIFTKTTWMLFLLGFFVACQDTIPYRSTITKGSSMGEPPICTEGQELATEIDKATGEETQICKEKQYVRPNNAVFWKPDFCACKDSKPVSYGNCSNFCAGKDTKGAETLFASFTVTEAISLGGLGNMYAWCKVNLPGDTQNPECELQAKDEAGNITTIEVSVPTNTNSLTANIHDKLAYDKTYVLTLVERTSGARSNSIQLVKFSTDVTLPVLGPLKNAPISQYTCMVREFSEDSSTGDIYYESAYRLHFYFIPRVPPKPIPAGNSNLICHDIFNPLYGNVDDVLYPRFEQLPGVFNLWDTTDPRFYDNNGNGQIDINEAIIQKTKNFGGSISASANFFQKFTWPGSPQLEDDAGNTNSTQPIGYFMAPWIDQTTFKSYCLNSSHYNSSNPLFKAMRDFIGVDTEGLYIGEKSPETVKNSEGKLTSGYPDYVLIRETDLKAVWFYLKNGVPTAPTDDNVGNNAVYYYYPLNKASPFVKTSSQRTFRVRSASELQNGTNGSTSSGGTSTFPPHDRKIGCIPKF